MDKRDGVGRFAIGDEGNDALNVELEARAILIVANILGNVHSRFGIGELKR
jgi:hypothetical protein